MRILVTGGQGFLGAWIVRRLVAGGHQPRVFDLGRRTELVERIAGVVPDWVEGDVSNTAQVLDAARGCDGIIHLAGILTPACAADPVPPGRVGVAFAVAPAIRQYPQKQSRSWWSPSSPQRRK